MKCTDMVRFSRHVQFSLTGCWNWTGAVNGYRGGYGMFATGGRKEQKLWRAHRYPYSVLFGDPGPEIDLHHLCENTACVNPSHVVELPKSWHSSIKKLDTCKYGHIFSADNVYIRPNGTRQCRKCRNRRWLICYYKKRVNSASTVYDMAKDAFEDGTPLPPEPGQ